MLASFFVSFGILSITYRGLYTKASMSTMVAFNETADPTVLPKVRDGIKRTLASFL